MNDALETLHAMRIMFEVQGNKKALRQICRDIEALEADKDLYDHHS